MKQPAVPSTDTSEREARNTVKRIVEARISDGQLARAVSAGLNWNWSCTPLCGCGDGCVTAASLIRFLPSDGSPPEPSWGLGPDPHTPLAVEIGETQRERMQPHRPRTAAAKEAVDGIANNRCSHRSEMGPQLMGTAGERAQPGGWLEHLSLPPPERSARFAIRMRAVARWMPLQPSQRLILATPVLATVPTTSATTTFAPGGPQRALRSRKLSGSRATTTSPGVAIRRCKRSCWHPRCNA